MLTKGFQGTPGSVDNLDEEGRSREPESRIAGKHALNPPIVTVLGAGIAGLTAAHELVERGFRVQVVEEREDPYNPGEPMIGGMAANQAARVRANIEDLHRRVIEIALQQPQPKAPAKGENPTPEYSEWKVAVWLLEMFAFNRSSWIQTERPMRLPRWLKANNASNEYRAVIKTVFGEGDEIGERDRFRERWLWDLTWRGVLSRTIHDRTDNLLINEASAVFKALLDRKDLIDMAKEIVTHQRADKVPDAAEIDANRDMVGMAFSREILCIRVRPSSWDDRTAVTFAGLLAGDLHPHADWKAPEGWKVPADWEIPKGWPMPEPSKMPIDSPGDQSGQSGRRESGAFLEVIEQRLPAEHGFHFFPTFYRHVEDTLRRIPVLAGGLDVGRTVLDGLKPTVRQGMGFSEADFDEMVKDEDGERPPDFKDYALSRGKGSKTKGGTVVDLLRNRPTSIEGFRDRNERFVARLGGTNRDSIWLFAKLFRYMTSSPERRRQQYEDISWEKFLDIKEFSKPMQHQITAAAQALLAFSSGEADARSYGNVAIQMLLDGLSDGSRVDRTLDGPLSEAWMNPWKQYLERQGVRFFRAKVMRLELVDQVRVEHRDHDKPVPAIELVPVFDGSPEGLLTHAAPDPSQRPDFYVMALNVEKASELVTSLRGAAQARGLSFEHETVQRGVRRKVARDFEALWKFSQELTALENNAVPVIALKDMTGLQFFFEAKTSIGHGHMYFPYTKWGLSSISQSEFWCEPGSFSDGYLGVLSVGICDTKKPTICDTTLGKQVPLSFSDIMKRPGDDPKTLRAHDVDRRRFEIAQVVFKELKARIDSKDDLANPRCFHVDQDIDPFGNKAKFLASLNAVKSPRPGTVGDSKTVGDDEIDYSLNFDRWVLAGTYMATHTRVTTMESANESGRHAARTVLETLGHTDAYETTGQVGGKTIYIKSLKNKTYNGAAEGHSFDYPDIFNVEELELEDLEFFRRLDRRLVSLGMKHFLDIIDFDKKLLHALDAVELYKGKPLKEFLALSLANLDTVLSSNLGQGYYARLDKRYNDAKASLPTLADDLPVPPFADMTKELYRLKKILDLF